MYVSSNAPLPQNSLMAPPASEAAASDARRLRNFYFSRTGRERVYANTPPIESFWAYCPALAVNAKGVLDASELSRQSVLHGIGVPPGQVGAVVIPGANTTAASAAAVLAGVGMVPVQAPVVYSLNGPAPASSPKAAVAGAAPVRSSLSYPTMPNAAPIPGPGVYIDLPAPASPAAAPRREVRSYSGRGGPGCSGLSGWGPPWGDALMSVTGAGQGSPVAGGLILAGLAVLGLLAISKKGGRG